MIIVAGTASALVLGPATAALAAPGTAPVQATISSTVVHPVSYIASDVGDDIKVVGKCTATAVGANPKAAKAGKSIWRVVKKRKLPSRTELKDIAGVAVSEVTASNPYLAGAYIIGCSVLTP
jgi:hypothetical protein